MEAKYTNLKLSYTSQDDENLIRDGYEFLGAGRGINDREIHVFVNETEESLNKAHKDLRKNEKLVGFLYILLRDCLPAGQVEEIVLFHIEKAAGKELLFSNGFLKGYARELAERLTKE